MNALLRSSVSHILLFGCRVNQASIFLGLLCVLQLQQQGHSSQYFRKFCFPLKGNSFLLFLFASQFYYNLSLHNSKLFFFFSRERLNSMNLLLYMAPIAVTCLLPATLIMEENVVGITIDLARKDVKLIWYLFFNSSLAYFVNLTNFLVTKHTSALTLQVLGNAKGAVAVVVSILMFKNPVSLMGMVGYALTVLGVILYSEAKKRYS